MEKIIHFEGCADRAVADFHPGAVARCRGCGSAKWEKVKAKPETILHLDRVLLSHLRATRDHGGKWIYGHDTSGVHRIFGHRYRVIDISEVKGDG